MFTSNLWLWYLTSTGWSWSMISYILEYKVTDVCRSSAYSCVNMTHSFVWHNVCAGFLVPEECTFLIRRWRTSSTQSREIRSWTRFFILITMRSKLSKWCRAMNQIRCLAKEVNNFHKYFLDKGWGKQIDFTCILTWELFMYSFNVFYI